MRKDGFKIKKKQIQLWILKAEGKNYSENAFYKVGDDLKRSENGNKEGCFSTQQSEIASAAGIDMQDAILYC